MRTREMIWADMTAIMDGATGRALTDDEVTRYEELERELQALNRDEALRQRHRAYDTIVTPAGVPSPAARQAEDDSAGFVAYLRTGRPNADLTPGPMNAQTTGTGSSGGYLVPEGFLNRIVEVIKSFGGVLNDAEPLTTETGNPLPFPTNDDTGNEAVVATENNAPASGADLVFGTVQLSAFEYAASGANGNALAVPLALIQDSAFPIEPYVARKLGQRIARKMARDAVTGTGTGQAQGILQGITGLEMVGSTLAYADLVSLVTAIDEAYWENAKLYCNRSSFATIMQVEDGANQLIFRQGAMTVDDKPVPAIWVAGKLVPVVLDSAFGDIVGTNGADDNWGLFGDVSEGYVWRQVRQIELLVNPYTSANKRQIEYNAWARADGRQKNTAAYKVAAGHTT